MRAEKRILIVSQYFYPENFRINEFAFEMVKRGYVVDALVSIPNYPNGKYFKGYGVFKRRHEVCKGVNIYRAFQFPRGEKASNLRLSLTYLSYAFFASMLVLFKFFTRKKYDAIIAFEPSPITCIIPAVLIGKLTHVKVLSWIQDIWPDSVTACMTGFKSRFLNCVLDPVTEWVYKGSDKILISSPGMEELVCRNKDYHSKLEYVPNWCDDFLVDGKMELPDLPNKKIIMMAGSINDSIGIDDIVNCIFSLKDLEDLCFVFVGDGSRKAELEKKLHDRACSNAILLGRFPFEMMPYFYKKADAMFLTLKETRYKHLDVTIPSRLQSYLSAGKPIFAMIGSGARTIIQSSDCGFVTPSGRYDLMASLIRENYLNRELLSQKGLNARNLYLKDFTLSVGINHFEKLIYE